MAKSKSKKKSKPASKKKAQTKTKTRSRSKAPAALATSIAPWLCVRGGARAVEFYKSALGAVEVFHMEGDGSVVARLSVEGAEFWLSDESPEHFNFSPESLG